jgi:hypothetical protein
VPATQSNRVLVVEALWSTLRISSFLSTVLLVLVDSSLAFALKVSYIIILVFSEGSTRYNTVTHMAFFKPPATVFLSKLKAKDRRSAK